MLDVHEPTAGPEQLEDFLVEYVLRCIGLVMNGIARHDKIERRLVAKAPRPAFLGVVLVDERKPGLL